MPPLLSALGRALTSAPAQHAYGALGTAGAMDVLTHGGPQKGDWDFRRVMNTMINGAAGAGGVNAMRAGKTMLGVNMMTSVPLVKDNLLNLLPSTAKLPETLDAARGAAERASGGAGPAAPATAVPGPAAPGAPAPSEISLSPGTKALAIGGGVAALGAGGILAYYLSRAAKRYADGEPETERTSQGTLRVTLPTSHPGDRETTVEVPLENLSLPQSIYGKLTRDTKRRLREETRERTFHRDPMTRKLLGGPSIDEAQNV